MKNEIEKSIIQKTKDFLDIKEECSSVELYNLLVSYRNQMHPDRYLEDSSKIIAEEKFKDAGKLLEDLFKYIEKEKLQRTPTELALYKPVYEQIYLQRELEILKEKNNALAKETKDYTNEISDLNQKIKEKDENNYKHLIEYLESLYKPSLKEWTSITLLFVLTVSITIMSKIEEVSSYLKKYSPIDIEFINLSLFIVFILLIFSIIKLYFESKIVKRKIRETNSTKYASDFMHHLETNNNSDDTKIVKFKEQDAFNFIYGSKAKFKRFLSFLGFRLYQVDTIDLLKNCFINNLLRKKLISISDAASLDRNFSINEPYRWDL